MTINDITWMELIDSRIDIWQDMYCVLLMAYGVLRTAYGV